MRRSQLPRILLPVNNANLSLTSEKSDEHVNERPNERLIERQNERGARRTQLPPIKDNTVLVAPPPGKPQYGRRAPRPKTGVHHSRSHGQVPPVPVPPAPTTTALGPLAAANALPMPPSTPEMPGQTPTPWRTEDAYLSYKDFVSGTKTPAPPTNPKVLPDIKDQKGLSSRNHLRIRPVYKELLILNEIEYNYEPAGTPSNVSQDFPPINGRSMRIKSPRVRSSKSRTTPQGSNTSLNHGSPTAEQLSGNPPGAPSGAAAHRPHLDKLLQKRGLARNNHFR